MITTTVVFVDRLLMSQTLLLRINIKMDTYSPLMFLERCSVWVSADLKHEDEMQQVREEIWERNSDCYCTTDTSSTQITSVITHTDLHDQSLPCVCVQGWVERAERGGLLSEMLDLSELFHPDTFLNALRQETARWWTEHTPFWSELEETYARVIIVNSN